ncbi:MAG: 50S ribosomal protein L13 [Candidatus Altiarchaeota archaeon]
MIIDAKDQVLGRMCAYAAKQALLGEYIIIVNAEKAIITGTKDTILKNYMAKLKIQNKGNYLDGPFHQKRPDKFLRKAIRGMLPYKKDRGRQAYKKIQVYIGVPKAEIEEKHKIKVTDKELKDQVHAKTNVDQYMTVGNVCRYMGGKW